MMHSKTPVHFAAAFLLSSLLIQGVDGARWRRVLRGVEAHSSDFFYQASLRSEDYHICGGTIISHKHILTAAHCVADLFVPPFDELTVVTGTDKLWGGNRHEVANVTWHGCYAEKGHVNDIAVITLKNTIDFDENQKPALLPKSPAPCHGRGVISGFGRAKSTDSYSSNILLMASAVALDRCECQKYMNHTISIGQICGVTANGGGIYKGDSGGPFVVDNVIIGIASWNIPWNSTVPDGYTDVFKYVDFIHTIMEQNN